ALLFFFFKQKTAYEIGLGIPAEPLFRSIKCTAWLMIHTPTAISIFVCLSMVQLMAVFISMRCTLCGHFLQVALTLILVVGYAIRSEERRVGKECRSRWSRENENKNKKVAERLIEVECW